MNSSYFASLVSLPCVIEQPGDYLTRGGEVVTLTQVSPRNDFGNVGAYANGITERWHRSGRIFRCKTTQNDIVAKVTV